MPDGTIVAGLTKNGKPHKNFKMPYLQEYIRNFGIRKCEANAIVPMPEEARELVEDTIIEFVGEDALERFNEKMYQVKEDMDEVRIKTGLKDTLENAIRLIDEI